MKNCNIILAGALALILSSCASQTQNGDASSSNPAKPASPKLSDVQASYSDRVDSQTLEQVKGACPSDSKWDALPWQKIMPLANACVKAKDWMKVEKMGDLLARKAHLTPWGPYYLALSAESRKDYPRAQWMLELALKKAPKEGLFHYEMGRINWELHEDADAIKHLQQASDLNPSLTNAHWILGQLAMQKGDLSGAEKYLTKALSVDSEHGPSLLTMAQVKMMGKDWDKAETFLMRSIVANPRSTKARVALAQVQEMNLKKFEEALRTYKLIRQLSAEHKLDENVQINLEDKIQTLQKSLSQAKEAGKVSSRQPSSNEGKVHE